MIAFTRRTSCVRQSNVSDCNLSERNVLRVTSGEWIAKNEQRFLRKSELDVEQIERRVLL